LILASLDQAVLPSLKYCQDAYECADGADALVIVTEWEQFRALDLDRIKRAMGKPAAPALIDLRNISPADELRRRGFIYESVLRPTKIC
jgi:UDPglucose 6-dehydrogenase